MALIDRIRRAFSPRDAVELYEAGAGLPRGVVGPWGTIGGGWPVEYDLNWWHWNRYNGYPGTAFGHGLIGGASCGESTRKWTVEQFYAAQPHLRTVVSFRALNMAHLPLQLYRAGEDGVRERDRGPLYDLLKRPNPAQTGYELIRDLVISLDLYGRAYWALVPSAESAAGWEIQPIPAQRVHPEGGTVFRPQRWRIEGLNDKRDFTIPARQMVEFKTTGPDGVTPISPVDALKAVLSEQVAAWQYRAQSWERGARTSGYVYRPKDAPEWSDKARDRFTEEWHEFARNGARAGETILLEDGMELRSTGFSPHEEEWSEVSQLSLRTVCSVYHVPPAMVGAEGATSYASAREFRSMLYTETLGPLIRFIEQRIDQFVLPVVAQDDTGLYVKFNLDAKLAGTFEEQIEAIVKATGAPILTVDEGREKLDRSPIDGGDQLVVPLNVTQGGQTSPFDGGEPSVAVQNAIEAGVDL